MPDAQIRFAALGRRVSGVFAAYDGTEFIVQPPNLKHHNATPTASILKRFLADCSFAATSRKFVIADKLWSGWHYRWWWPRLLTLGALAELVEPLVRTPSG
jgi:hypothetical protein